MDPIREQIERLTRRHFFGRTGLSLGTAALSSLLTETRARAWLRRRLAALPAACRRSARSAPFPTQGQAGDLSVHERRPVADRPVRLQAQDGRHSSTRTCPSRSGWASG